MSQPPTCPLTRNCRMTVNYLLSAASAVSKQSENTPHRDLGFKKQSKRWKVGGGKQFDLEVSVINEQDLSQKTTQYEGNGENRSLQ